MFTLFARAAAGQNLTPAQRAMLRLIEGILVAGLVAAIPIVADALNAQAPDWGTVGRAAIAAFLTAVLMAVLKYVKAHADDPLPEATPLAPPVRALPETK